MSHEATTWAWKQDVANPIRKMILLFVADAANPEKDWNTWHSFRTISEACNCSVGAISNHMQWLVENQYLTLIRQGKKRGETNRYRLNVGDVSVQIGPKVDCSPDEHKDINCSSAVYHRSSGGYHRSSGVDKPITTVKEPVRKKEREKLPPDFVEMVLRVHSEILPELGRVRIWDESQARAQYLRKIYLDTHFDAKNEDFWRAYFGYVRENDWWMGRNNKPDKKFKASFEFLVHPAQCVRIVEGCLNGEAA